MRLSRKAVVRGVLGLGLLGALATSTACATSSLLHAARSGDRPALGRGILGEESRGALSRSQVAELARAVIEHEVKGAPTPEYALARVREVKACAFEVDDVLAARMKTDDVAGAEAALERVEAGAISAGSAREHAKAGDDRWRAAFTWGLTGSGDHAARLEALRDGSVLVRRAAIRAIVDRDDETEEAAVLEAARLDPDPLVRGTAVRALSRMAGPPADLANRLRDLWATGDDGLREDVAAALASRAVFRNGGREALAHLIETSQGNQVVTLAGVILGADVDDAVLRGEATARLALALTEGAHRARIHAIAVAPLRAGSREADATNGFLEGLRASAKAEDLDVRLAALGRLSDVHGAVSAKDRDAAITALEAMAAPTEVPSVRASRARFLLAEAGDLRVQAWVEADLKAPDADARLNAAEALAGLGRASRAAPLLADEDPSVRTRAACVMLVAAKLR